MLSDLAEDARAAIRAYEAAGRRSGGGSSTAMVLDAAAVELHPGGAATERTHQVTHVLDAQGVEQLGEVTIPPGAEVLALRTIKPDGTAVEPERAGSAKGSVSLTGLAVGDYVDVEWLRTVRGLHPSLGHAADPFYFQVPATPLFRSTYVVRAPAGLGLEVDAHGMKAPPVARRGGPRAGPRRAARRARAGPRAGRPGRPGDPALPRGGRGRRPGGPPARAGRRAAGADPVHRGAPRLRSARPELGRPRSPVRSR